MEQSRYSTPIKLSLIGAILILINGAIIIQNNSNPIIISTYQASSTKDIQDPRMFWGRIISGAPGLVERGMAYFWLIFPIGILLLDLWLIRKPRKHAFAGPIIALFAILSLPIGGGFVLGTILAFLGGVAGYEWPKPFKETFFGRMIRVAFLSTKSYNELAEQTNIAHIGVLSLIFVGLIGGIGSSLYAYNVNLINPVYDAKMLKYIYSAEADGILLGGILKWAPVVYLSAFSLIGFTVLKWIVLSVIVYVVITRINAKEYSFSKLAGVLAFAYIPECILIFTPFVMTNEPMLSQGVRYSFLPYAVIPISWPLLLYYLSRIWVFIIVVRILESLLEFFRSKAFGIALFTGVLYFIVNNLILMPLLQVPGIRLEFPQQSLLSVQVIMTFLVLLAIPLGAFKKE
ncbi:MAG: hypothetical protein QW279_01525 [Candidatus Jordarchaeaceae archaeon]